MAELSDVWEFQNSTRIALYDGKPTPRVNFVLHALVDVFTRVERDRASQGCGIGRDVSVPDYSGRQKKSALPVLDSLRSETESLLVPFESPPRSAVHRLLKSARHPLRRPCRLRGPEGPLGSEGTVQVCEFISGKLFRSVHLPEKTRCQLSPSIVTFSVPM